MKTLVSAFLIIVLAGCQPNGDSKVAALEKRLMDLEMNRGEVKAQMAELRDQIGKAIDILAKQHADGSNYVRIAETQQRFSQAISESLKVALDTIEKHDIALNRPGAPRPTASATTKAPVTKTATTKNGVPIAVYNSIKAEAERRHPNDFSTQDYVIKREVEAYLKLHP